MAGILIVEDSFIVAMHLETALSRAGYHIAGKCESGEEALKFLEHIKPDLVLMDIMLAGIQDGVETAKIIRSIHEIPIIFLTALTDVETMDRIRLLQPDGYLSKPFSDADVLGTVGRLIPLH